MKPYLRGAQTPRVLTSILGRGVKDQSQICLFDLRTK